LTSRDRQGPAPLLTALLALGDAWHSGRDDPVVQQQWALFEPQLRHAPGTGPLTAGSGPVLIARAPGRLDLMGGNDDYTGGLVFEATIAEATFCAAQRRAEPIVYIRNQQMSQQDVTLPVSVLRHPDATAASLAAHLKQTFDGSRWQLYVVGVLFWLQKRFGSQMFDDGQCGLSLVVWSTVPPNRGVSSSASVEVGRDQDR
jgi:galactokinase